MSSKQLLLALLISTSVAAQSNHELGIDCNPKLNPTEIKYLKNALGDPVFNFEGKNIGFATTKYANKVLSFPNWFLPIDKKEFFRDLVNDTKSKLVSRLIVLDSSQKKETYGFDAIILVYDKKKQNKADKADFNRVIEVFGYRQLNYPDNLTEVGNDINPDLSAEDAKFFNQIFRHQRKSFDFTGKKLAILNTLEDNRSKSLIPKKEYITRIKKHLDDDFLFPYDQLHVLSEKEKAEYGDYDAIIIYMCKGCTYIDALRRLKPL